MRARVLVGVPSGDSVPISFFTTFSNATKISEQEGTWTLYSVRGMNTVSARNKIVFKALKEGYTHVFFMDSDMSFPTATLSRLLHSDKDIVGGFYCRKKEGYLPNAFELGSRKGDQLKIKFLEDFQEVEAIGTGCLLIKTEVFKAVGKPWFEYEPINESPDGHMATEDMVFCKRAKDKGYNVFCDGTIKCGHIGAHIVTPATNRHVKVEPV